MSRLDPPAHDDAATDRSLSESLPESLPESLSESLPESLSESAPESRPESLSESLSESRPESPPASHAERGEKKKELADVITLATRLARKTDAPAVAPPPPLPEEAMREPEEAIRAPEDAIREPEDAMRAPGEPIQPPGADTAHEDRAGEALPPLLDAEIPAPPPPSPEALLRAFDEIEEREDDPALAVRLALEASGNPDLERVIGRLCAQHGLPDAQARLLLLLWLEFRLYGHSRETYYILAELMDEILPFTVTSVMNTLEDTYRDCSPQSWGTPRL